MLLLAWHNSSRRARDREIKSNQRGSVLSRAPSRCDKLSDPGVHALLARPICLQSCLCAFTRGYDASHQRHHSATKSQNA
eukprot:3848644-Rhodomonas_salina.2